MQDVVELERQQNVKGKCFRLDNVGEFSSKIFNIIDELELDWSTRHTALR